ncbi:IclR family transcriptional regulator [Ruegeria sediminis]|uniref:IclR family transcriptional regulator n=1 Tax=Ruegeria sediminis TaxID=2583820 RepID=A0ABY2WUK1_9RHOB|nr:helix-turn-helix domain-containing protein [Ruegeria sediminis]TMV05704.1 IclR family transcriptional regulator [Ruegeria sediminis]
MTKLNRSIDRGLSVLEVVHTSGRISLAVLAARTSLPKATLLRICATLEARRWLFRRSSDGNYQLGSAFPQGNGMPNRVDRLVAVAKDEILRLSHDTGLGSDLAAGIGGGRVEIVDTTRRFQVHGVFPDTVGFRPSPVLSALGTAYLFALSGADRAQALQALASRLPREDVKALPGLASVLKGIAERGYAVRPAGHWGRAVDYGELPAAIAVPIVAGKEPVGAVNLVWKATDHSVEAVAKDHLSRLRSAARIIGRNYADLS